MNVREVVLPLVASMYVLGLFGPLQPWRSMLACGLDLRLALSGHRFGARSTTDEENTWFRMSTYVTLQETAHHMI
jgi:hypothetical protein